MLGVDFIAKTIFWKALILGSKFNTSPPPEYVAFISFLLLNIDTNESLNISRNH